MKRLFAIILLCVIILVAFTGCGFNKQILDLNYEYDAAIVNMFDGTSKEVIIKKWKDYEGEQIQFVDSEGNTWLVSSINCHLINY